MADFPTTGAAGALRLAGREAGHVVLMHVALRLVRTQRAQHLLFSSGAERNDGQRLGLAAREQAGTVRARQQPNLAGDGPDLVEAAAIRADVLVQDLFAHGVLEGPFEGFGHFGGGGIRQRGADGGLIAADLGVVFRLVGESDSAAGELGLEQVGYLRFKLGRNLVQRELPLRLDGHGDQALLHGAEFDDGAVRQLERVDHQGFGDCVGARFHHQDGMPGASHHQIKVASLELLLRRVDQQLAIDVTHAHAADRPGKGDVGDGDGGGGGDEPQDVGRVLLVGRKGSDDDLHVVAEALGEERAQRTVDQAAGEDGFIRRAALAAHVAAARKLPGSVEALFIVNREREKIGPRSGILGGHDRGQDDGIAIPGGDGPAGLTGDLAGF